MPSQVSTEAAFPTPAEEFAQPFGLTRCTAPDPASTYDVSGVGYDPDVQMSVRDGRLLIDGPVLGTGVQCTVTTTEDMQSWADQVTDG